VELYAYTRLMGRLLLADMNALDDIFEGLPTTLTVSEAAKLFNVSEDVIRGHITSTNPKDRLPALRLGRAYVILTIDYKHWIQQRYSGIDE
jgi:hypothetical protein